MYDGSQERAILVGPEDFLFDTKNLIEQVEQDRDNQAHKKALKEKYLTLLTAGGYSTQDAEQFLKYKMPGLFQ